MGHGFLSLSELSQSSSNVKYIHQLFPQWLFTVATALPDRFDHGAITMGRFVVTVCRDLKGENKWRTGRSITRNYIAPQDMSLIEKQ